MMDSVTIPTWYSNLAASSNDCLFMHRLKSEEGAQRKMMLLVGTRLSEINLSQQFDFYPLVRSRESTVTYW